MIKRPNKIYRKTQNNNNSNKLNFGERLKKFQKNKKVVKVPKKKIKKNMTVYQHIRRREYIKKLKSPQEEVVPIIITGRKKTKEALLKKKKTTRLKKKQHQEMMREQRRVRQQIKKRPPKIIDDPKQRWKIPKKIKPHTFVLGTVPTYLCSTDRQEISTATAEFVHKRTSIHVTPIDDSTVFANFILRWFSKDDADSLFTGTRTVYTFYKQFKLANYYSISTNLSVSIHTLKEEVTLEDATILNLVNLYYYKEKLHSFNEIFSIGNTARTRSKSKKPTILMTAPTTIPNHLANFYSMVKKKKIKKYTDSNIPCPLKGIFDARRVRANTYPALENFKNLKDVRTIIELYKLEYLKKQIDMSHNFNLFKIWECENLIWKKIWKLHYLHNLNKMKILETKKVGPLGNRSVKILQIGCVEGGCFSTCQKLQKCTKLLSKLPENIMQQSISNPSKSDASIMNSFLNNLQRGITSGHRAFPNKNASTHQIKPKLTKPLDAEIAFGDIKLKLGSSSFCEYSKVIRTPGLSRSYHKKSVKILSMADFTGLYRKGQPVKIRIKKRRGTTRFENVKHNLNFLKNKSLVNLFSNYVQQTKPALTYYLVRKRSYIKKRKVFINSFKLKIAKDFNRQNKLFHQIKTIYFRGRNRKTAGNITRSTRKFLSRELFKMGHNKLLAKKKQIYKNYGHDSMNELLLKFL